jgi:hypothetical protein
MTTVLWLNKETNKIDNITIDDKPISEINLPDPYTALDKEATLGINYVYFSDTKEIFVDEGLGIASIGFTWDGEKLIGPQPIIPE